MASNPHLPAKSVFLCYRRLDSEDVVDRVYESFQREFPREALFRDIDTIPPGVDFPAYVHAAIESCRVVLVFIGRDWLNTVDAQGGRRLEDPRDHVRIEIESALQIPDMRVIPVLVRRAEMPGEVDLPGSLKPLAIRNAISVRSGFDYQSDVGRLIHHVRDALEQWTREREPRDRPNLPEPPIKCDLQLPQGTVFISHADEDRTAARRLANAFKTAGLNVWPTQFSGTQAFRDAQARKALEQCEMFLPLISQHTENQLSGFFHTEWNLAASHNAGKAGAFPFIVPVLIDSLQPRVQRDVLKLRHYEVHLVPPEFRDLATTTCPGGRPNARFIAWIREAVLRGGDVLPP